MRLRGNVFGDKDTLRFQAGFFSLSECRKASKCDAFRATRGFGRNATHSSLQDQEARTVTTLASDSSPMRSNIASFRTWDRTFDGEHECGSQDVAAQLPPCMLDMPRSAGLVAIGKDPMQYCFWSPYEQYDVTDGAGASL
jgi:hypothetical protein